MRTSMTNDWQTTQIFLSDNGVFEVEVSASSYRLRCGCNGYSTRLSCKHTRFVKQRMNANNGVYPTEISNRASKVDSLIASKDPKAFRELLVHYGKIEVV